MSISTVRLVRSILGLVLAFFFIAHKVSAASASVTAGQAVALSTSVDGTAPFWYQWYKDGVAVSGATNSTFSIDSFSAFSVGNYSVVVANSAGWTVSDIATLTLNLPSSLPQVLAPDTSLGFSDSSFENINVGSNAFTAFAYDPSGSAWSFAGWAGITGNNSGFTSGAASAPDGGQVAFIQNNGSITQTINLQAGTYAISALVANRLWGGQQSVLIYVNGSYAGTFTGGAVYSQATSNYFTVTTGSCTISFVGTATADSTLFLDKISLTSGSSSTSVAMGNSGFESPNVGSYYYGAYQYTPPTTTGNQDWSFLGYSGIAGNGSGFTAGSSNAPEGGQVAFLQSSGSEIAQTLSFSTSGSYTLSLSTAQRGNWNAGSQLAYVYLDGRFLGTVFPSSATFQTVTISFSTSQGSHRLSIKATVNGDCTLFLDRLSITPN